MRVWPQGSTGCWGYGCVERRSGSILVAVIILVITVTAIGLALAGVTSRDISNSSSVRNREQALMAADGGVDYGLWWLANYSYSTPGTAPLLGYIPSGSTGLSSTVVNLTMPGSGATYNVAVYNQDYPTTGAWPGCKVLVSTATAGAETVKVMTVLQNSGQNAFAWSNALFAGGGQLNSASSVSIHGPVDIVGNGVVGDAIDFTGASAGDFNNYQDGLGFENYYVSGQDNGVLVTASMSAKVSGLPTNGSGLATMNTKFRVKNGKVGVASPADIGLANHIAGQKSTVDGTYVTSGWTTGSAAQVTSDNGTSTAYDAGSVPVPSLLDPAAGYPSESQIAYDQDVTNNPNTLIVSSLTLGRSAYMEYTIPHPAYILGNYPAGPYLVQTWVDVNEPADNHEDYFNLQISGTIYVQGPVVIGNNHAGAHGGADIITYTGTGTIVAGSPVSGSTFTAPATMDIYAQLLAAGSASTGAGFVGPDATSTNPAPALPRNVLGLVSTGDIDLHNDHGFQSWIMAALFAQNNINFDDNTSLVGTAVARNQFGFTGAPSLFFVPELPLHLPPGLPGTAPYNLGGLQVMNYEQLQ